MIITISFLFKRDGSEFTKDKLKEFNSVEDYELNKSYSAIEMSDVRERGYSGFPMYFNQEWMKYYVVLDAEQLNNDTLDEMMATGPIFNIIGDHIRSTVGKYRRNNTLKLILG